MDKNVLIILCVYLTQADHIKGAFSFHSFNVYMACFWW